jgi:hypothetical protein
MFRTGLLKPGNCRFALYDAHTLVCKFCHPVWHKVVAWYEKCVLFISSVFGSNLPVAVRNCSAYEEHQIKTLDTSQWCTLEGMHADHSNRNYTWFWDIIEAEAVANISLVTGFVDEYYWALRTCEISGSHHSSKHEDDSHLGYSSVSSHWSRPTFQGAYCLHHHGGSTHVWKVSLLQWDYMVLYARRLFIFNGNMFVIVMFNKFLWIFSTLPSFITLWHLSQ